MNNDKLGFEGMWATGKAMKHEVDMVVVTLMEVVDQLDRGEKESLQYLMVEGL